MTDSTDLVAEGYVDSLAFLTLLKDMEKAFDVSIDFADAPIEELMQLGPLSRFVAEQIAVAAG